MAVVLFSLRRNYPKTILGLSDWASGMTAWFMSGLAMVLLQGRVPPLVSIATPNVLVLAGAYLFWRGAVQFLCRPRARSVEATLLGLVGAVMVGVVWFTVAEPSYTARITLIASAMLILFAALAWLLLRHGAKSFSHRLVFGVALLVVMNNGVRLYTVSTGSATQSLFDSLPQNVAYVTLLPVLVLLLSIGFVLMATDRLRHELESLARQDPLTGALARRGLVDAGDMAVERYRSQSEPLSVLYMDLDHFKSINDTHGHAVGDEVLKRFVSHVRGLTRTGDSIGRLGGEEFLAVLPRTTEETARSIAERIRHDWAASTQQPRSTVSIGVASMSAGDEGFPELIAQGDGALYRAKQGGRNRVVVWSDDRTGAIDQTARGSHLGDQPAA